MRRALDHLAAAGGAVRAVAADPQIRRLEAGWLISVAGDWAFLVVALVVAYQVGGAGAVGLFGLVRMLPTIVAAPLVGTLSDRFAGEKLLVVVHLMRAVAAVVLAGILAADGPTQAIFVAGAIVAGATSFVRPIQAGLMPALVVNPSQLIASNVASSTAEGLGTLLGPAIGGLLVGTIGPAPALAIVGAAFGVGAVIAAGIHVPSARRPAHLARPGVRASVGAGARSLVDRPGAGVLFVSLGAQTFVRGLLTTLIVVASIELLQLGESGVGGLNAAIGIGGLVGAIAAVGLAGRRQLAPAFAVALSAWSLPIAVIAVWPTPLAAVSLLFVVGIANAALDIAGFTLLQRNVPNEARAAVLGLVEGLVGITVAIGAGLAPLLVEAFGIRGALAVSGAILPIVAMIGWPRVSRCDRDAVVPEAEMNLLEGVPFFRPLPLTVIEQLAGSMRPVSFAAGEVLMREGEPGDTYLILTSGSVEVSIGGRVLSTMGPGSGLGEIAVLRRVPRTATVRALEPVGAQALASVDFVAAVSGSAASSAAAGVVIDERLDASASTG